MRRPRPGSLIKGDYEAANGQGEEVEHYRDEPRLHDSKPEVEWERNRRDRCKLRHEHRAVSQGNGMDKVVPRDDVQGVVEECEREIRRRDHEGTGIPRQDNLTPSNSKRSEKPLGVVLFLDREHIDGVHGKQEDGHTKSCDPRVGREEMPQNDHQEQAKGSRSFSPESEEILGNQRSYRATHFRSPASCKP
jgi:hypothetical protein